MRILYFEVGKKVVELNVENTLSSLAQLVGGNLEVVSLFPDNNTILVCNEEGRILNLPPNRTLKKVKETIYGNFFVCKFNNNNMCSIDDDMIYKVIKLF